MDLLKESRPIRIEGLIGVSSAAHSSFQVNASVGAKGVRSSNGQCAVGVSLSWSTTFGPHGSCPPPNTTPYDSSPLWIDTVSVGGVYNYGMLYGQPVPGGATRGPKIVEPSFSPCQDSYEVCHGYSGAQTIRLTPLASQLALFPADTVTYAGQTLSFSARANPSQIGSHVIPVYVVAWKWIPDGGTGVQPPGWSCAPGNTPCQIYIQQTGLVEVTARVNGVVQVDSTKVTVFQPKVKITLEMSTMRPSTLTTVVRDTSFQAIRVSVEGITGPIANRTVSVSLMGAEGTAGHSHLGSKPKGNFFPTGATTLSVNTGSTGVFKIDYQAPDPSGTVTIKGVSSGATPDSAIIEVAYPGLVELTEGSTYLLTGHKPAHPRNHYGTQAHVANLKKLADFFFAKFGDRPTFNDTSLQLGGLYDVEIYWTYPHRAHRQGRHTDLKTTEPQRTEAQRIALWIAWERLGGTVRDETKNIDGTPNTTNPHYHLIY